MKDLITGFFIKVLPKSIVYRIEKPFRQRLMELNECYSQNGEDVLLRRIFKDKLNGFFVDIGAHNPIYLSNTYSLYLRGWRGLNIDAMPGSMLLFNKVRPGDKNIEIGVSEKEQIMTFYTFNEPALNTFSKAEADKKNGKSGYFITGTTEVKTLPLWSIFDQYVPAKTPIDYLNIDIEGLDIEALRSNDWEKYNPTVISVECSFNTGTIQQSEVYIFLNKRGYKLVSVLYNTLIFTKNDASTHSAVSI